VSTPDAPPWWIQMSAGGAAMSDERTTERRLPAAAGVRFLGKGSVASR
jgi:hypothetical protein